MMKRILSVILAALLLLPLLLLPAFAAEPDEYVFEYVEPVMTLQEDYDFPYDSEQGYFIYPGHLPDGKYYLQISDPVGTVYSSTEFDIIFPGWFSPTNTRSRFFESPRLPVSPTFRSGDGKIRDYSDPFVVLLRYYRDSSSSDFASSVQIYTTWWASSDAESYTSFGPFDSWLQIKLVRIPPPALDSVGVVLSENPTAAFDHIISLLPIVLPVLVCFIGIRKAISYVRSKVFQA